MSLKDIKDQWGSQTAFLDAVAPGADQSLVAAVTGKHIVVDELFVSCGVAAGSVFLEKGAATKVFPTIFLPINGSAFCEQPGISTDAGQALTATTAGVGSTISVFVRYHLEG